MNTLYQIQSPRGIHLREEELWYAMRATYRRGQQARELLENAGAKCFIPMKWEEKSVRGRKVRRYTPVAGNLIFVYGRQSVIQNVKSRAEYLQYMTDSRSREKITVPEEQMQQFIAAVGSYNEQFIFLKASDIDLTKGEKVRITGGEFEGRTGTGQGGQGKACCRSHPRRNGSRLRRNPPKSGGEGGVRKKSQQK